LQQDNIRGDAAIALWQNFQRELHAAIRANAPRHTIILNTHEYGLPEEILKLQPLNDPNTIYNFHFYQPFVFTHQGADWALDEARYWQRVPYPSSPDECVRRNWRPDRRGGDDLAAYCTETWNKARLELLIKPAADWAKRNNVRLISNEFGVYRPAVVPADRAAWLRDVREIFEAYNIGWAMWDYSEGFGLVQPDANGRRVLDTETLRALGL
jgi:endoglucanase